MVCFCMAGYHEAAAEPSEAGEASSMDTGCMPAEQRVAEGQDAAGSKPHAHVPFSVRNAALLRAIPFCCKRFHLSQSQWACFV